MCGERVGNGMIGDGDGPPASTETCDECGELLDDCGCDDYCDECGEDMEDCDCDE